MKSIRLICRVVGIAAVTLAGAAPSAGATERVNDKSIEVAASLDDAWAAWTTREGITSSFASDAKVEPRVGGAFRVYIDPLAEPGMKGADDMRFMAIQAKIMISFDWNAPPHPPEARAQRTFVIVRFESLGDKSTRIFLHHTGWGEGGELDKANAYFDRAWGGVPAGLKKKRFDSGPQDWAGWLEQLRKLHADVERKPATAS